MNWVHRLPGGHILSFRPTRNGRVGYCRHGEYGSLADEITYFASNPVQDPAGFLEEVLEYFGFSGDPDFRDAVLLLAALSGFDAGLALLLEHVKETAA